MSDEERACTVQERKARRVPWHAPPRFEYEGEQIFIITAACYEHKPIIGSSAERMAECEDELLRLCHEQGAQTFAWCILPNHYHLLATTPDLNGLMGVLGKYHGSSSFRWNGEDGTRGRKVWYRALERSMRSERHYYASLNYVNHNAVKHGYVSRWQDWPYSSANQYLANVGTETALKIWREYPVLDYGKDWDP